MNLSKFERYPLTFGPTAIEPLPRLSAALDDKVEIFAKRDDCNSGLALGGNKLRKMEYLVPDILASGADTLVSICILCCIIIDCPAFSIGQFLQLFLLLCCF